MIRITVGLWAAGGSGSVIYTADGGVIWSKQTVPNSWARFFATDFIDDKKGWIVGEGIHYTTDGGINWSKLNKDIAGDVKTFRSLMTAPAEKSVSEAL